MFVQYGLVIELPESDDRDLHLPSTNSLHQPHLVRSLGLMDVVMVGIAGMIGGSIFVLTGSAIGLAGTAVIIVFILNAIITTFTAMGYAELGSAMPEAGGGYLWIRQGLPRPNAFISGWLAWFAHIVAGSLYAVGFGSFMSSLFDIMNITSTTLFSFIHIDKLVAVLSIIAFMYINIRGASETGKAGTIVTIIQLGTIFLLIVGGIWSISNNPQHWEINFSDFMPMGIAGIIAAMGLTFIAFEGYEIIVQTGEEIKNPKRNIPRAIFISLAIVVVMYCLVALVTIGATYISDTTPSWKFIGDNGELGIMKAANTFIPYGSFIVLIGGLVSTLAALNATTFSSARVALAMGRHYNLPHRLSSIHIKNKTPHVATIISCIVMTIMAYMLPLNQIAIAAGVIFLLLFTQVNVAVITIRRMYGDKLDYGYKTPLFPVIPIIGIFLNLGLAVYLLITEPLSWGITALWVLVGFVLYRMYTFKKEIEHYAPIITSQGDLTRKDFRILLPYTPENPDRLIRYAIKFAQENEGEINVLRVITVPAQTPLSAGVAFSETARKSFGPLEKIIDEESIMNHYLVRISHDPTEAILATITEQKIDLLITDFETIRRNKKLQTLSTCNIIAIKTTGGDNLLFAANKKEENIIQNNNLITTKNLVILYDERHQSEIIPDIIKWLGKNSLFKIIILHINTNTDEIQNDSLLGQTKNHEDISIIKYLEDFEYSSFEISNIYLSKETEINSEKISDLILSALNTLQPDLIVTNTNIGKFNFLTNLHLQILLNQLSCPIIITKDFAIPVVHGAKLWLSTLFKYRLLK